MRTDRLHTHESACAPAHAASGTPIPSTWSTRVLLIPLVAFGTSCIFAIDIPTDTRVGTWDSVNRIYTLTGDVNEEGLVVVEDNLVLDGNSHLLQGGGSGDGVRMDGRGGVTVKNLRIHDFDDGIHLLNSHNNTLDGNFLISNRHGGVMLERSDQNRLIRNTVTEHQGEGGIWLYEGSDNNEVTLNDSSSNPSGYGIYLDGDSHNTVTWNTANGNSIGIRLNGSSRSTVRYNTVSDNQTWGMDIWGGNWNEVYSNNFMNNPGGSGAPGQMRVCGQDNVFYRPPPVGGNYYSDWTSPDANNDGFVDVPYRFYCDDPSGIVGQDHYALTEVVDSPREIVVSYGVQIYAGLSITGMVGTVYSLEYVTDLAQTNTPSAWRCLEFLQLPASPYLWVDKSTPATSKRFYRAVAMEAPTNMVFIPPGTFMMGSPTNEVDRYDDEGPQTAVTISRGYWMGKYEVTQGEYLEVMGYNPSWFNGDHTTLGGPDYGTDLARPVERVSWDHAVAYCTVLTERERLAGRISPSSVYRLPTEAEWEYACRGWTSTRFSYGDDPGYTNLTNYAWYGENSDDQTHPVGQKLPNPWGLHDMHGNVWEWCQDWWSDQLPGGIALDPQGPETGSDRMGRGGFFNVWFGSAGYCRSAGRMYGFRPYEGRDFIGFRAVLAPGQPRAER